MNERVSSRNEMPQPNRFFQACLENQKAWRERKKLPIHSPELQRISRLLDKRIKKVFRGYIAPDFPQLLMQTAVLYDDRIYDLPYQHGGAQIPEQIDPQDHLAYIKGIHLITEWATNYATDHVITQSLRVPPLREIGKGYGFVCNTLTYGLDNKFMYDKMRLVKKQAKKDGVDFNHAVFTGFFQHDTAALDNLISATDQINASTVDELAVEIGKSTQPRESTSNTSSARRSLNNLTVGGLYKAPGLVEIGLPPQAFIGTSSAVEVVSGAPKGFLAFNAALSSVFLYTLVHEVIHGYSASETHRGFRPAVLQEKKSH